MTKGVCKMRVVFLTPAEHQKAVSATVTNKLNRSNIWGGGGMGWWVVGGGGLMKKCMPGKRLVFFLLQ